MAKTPNWLTDESIERTEAFGQEMMKFLERRRSRKRGDPNAKVRMGPRLRKILADLESDRK